MESIFESIIKLFDILTEDRALEVASEFGIIKTAMMAGRCIDYGQSGTTDSDCPQQSDHVLGVGFESSNVIDEQLRSWWLEEAS